LCKRNTTIKKVSKFRYLQDQINQESGIQIFDWNIQKKSEINNILFTFHENYFLLKIKIQNCFY